MLEKDFIEMPLKIQTFPGPSIQFHALHKGPRGGWYSCRNLWWTCRDYIGDFLHFHKPIEKTEDTMTSLNGTPVTGWKPFNTDALRFMVATSRKESFEENLRHLPILEKEVNPKATPTKVFKIADKDGHYLIETDNFWQETCLNNSLYTLWIRVLSTPDIIPDTFIG